MWATAGIDSLICTTFAGLLRGSAVIAWEKYMRILILIALLLAHGLASAQSASQPSLSYTFGELRYVDIDNGGDGFELGGSLQFNSNWFGVASMSFYDLDSNVDGSTFEIGAGYIFPLKQDWDLQANARIISVSDDMLNELVNLKR